MYLQFFKLKQLPFRLTPDLDFHYLGDDRGVAKAALQRAIGDGIECILVSGEAGVGKTILLQDALRSLPPRTKIVDIRQPELSPDEFYRATAHQLGLDLEGATEAARTTEVLDFIGREAANARKILIVVDNVELLTGELLHEIHKLPQRCRAAGESPCVIFMGRAKSGQLLPIPRIEGRIPSEVLRLTLSPLTVDSTREYIDYRLRVAGRAGAIFAPSAFAEFQRYSGGIPRLINTLADAALGAAYSRNSESITGADIRTVANQMHWVEYGARSEPGAKAAVSDEVIGHLSIAHNSKPVIEFDLPLGILSLGRALTNDIRVDSRYVSRNHCRIVTSVRYSVIEDMQSQNGLVILDHRVSVHRLEDGDVIAIGEHTLTYSRRAVGGARVAVALPIVVSAEAGRAEGTETGLFSQEGESKTRPGI
jgi:general secretion pathway protein A